jgi:hypothetical protein
MARRVPTRSPSLLESIQLLLERTYRMQSGIEDPGRFVIGDRGYALLYAGEETTETVTPAGAADGTGARMLVRESPDCLRACIYYPDDLIEHLERFPPQQGVGEENVDAFAALVEELDHLLLLAERTRSGRPVTLFELELHANVSKHLVLTRFLAGKRSRLPEAQRLWLRHQLFEKDTFCDADSGVRQRYRDACHWAVRMIDGLATLPVSARIDTLRRFHDEGAQGKLDLIRELMD